MGTQQSALVYERVEDSVDQYLRQYFTNIRSGYLRCKGYVLPDNFRLIGDRIRKMEIRPDDVWVCSLPRTGSTWVQEMVWCIANDVNLNAATERLLETRFPFLELSATYDEKLLGSHIPLPKFCTDSVGFINSLPSASPRFIKTHLPYCLLPEELQQYDISAKIVYVTRNPIDTCISYYYHCKRVEGITCDFSRFIELFMSGAVNYLPYWKHVLEYWQQRANPNVLFLTYEEMSQDLKRVIVHVAEFLDKHLTDEQIQTLADHLSFENMRNNCSVNREEEAEMRRTYGMNPWDDRISFMRCGQVQQWKNKMPPCVIDHWKNWEKNNLHGIKYPFTTDFF